ncbi:hypothetical protein BLNAU_5886 [Blattamonas nauphoetae]|uniref:Uncharacterized protein n=1 Tax=Blattamonas nauphoetae TaxID=2049346 RepID=A0ABQ9Y5T2_9EUKA|nr:hypothetical protein BLNAU_5886 [Blattamonas nauphoetae]
MLVDKISPYPQVVTTKAKQTNFLEALLRQICGECKTLRPTMLNDLLLLVTESDWALSTILDMEYIKPLEEYCEQTQPCDVPVALPKLLTLIGVLLTSWKASEGELDRICRSSIPSFFLKSTISTLPKNMINEIANCLLLWTSTLRSSSVFLAHHKTQFLAFIDHRENSESSFPHLTILARLCISPQLEVSKMTLKALTKRSKVDSETCTFLRTLKVPSGSTESSSELVPFAERLYSTLSELVSEMKSLFSESSPSDGTISALSTTLPDESPLLSGSSLLDVLCEGLFLLDSLLIKPEAIFEDILIGSHFVPLLKSTIIACLDLLERQKSESNCPPSDQTDTLIKILDWSWKCASDYIYNCHGLFNPIVESAFSDVPQLCSLLERTCCHSSPTHFSHLRMIINIDFCFPRLLPRMLEENLVERVINTSKTKTVQTSNGDFHLYLIWAINNLLWDPITITVNIIEWKRITKLQFDRVLKPAKQYLQFILQREELIPKAVSRNKDLSTRINSLLTRTLALERNLLENGEIVETGREECEVGWLVEKTNESDLGERLKRIRKDDVKMKMNAKSRWKKRVERLRESGHEDAVEGWLTQRDTTTRSEIVEYLESVGKESGMSVRL